LFEEAFYKCFEVQDIVEFLKWMVNRWAGAGVGVGGRFFEITPGWVCKVC
jgi:hypothetical protein